MFNESNPILMATNQWYAFFDAGRNAANNLITDVKKIQEFRDKEKEGKKNNQEQPIGKRAKVRQVIRYVEKPVNYCLSALGFSLLLLATGLLIWQLYGKIKSYIDNPVQVATTYSYPDSMPFPGVILCNTKPLRISYIGPTPMMAVIDYFHLKENVSFDDQFREANLLNITSFYLAAVQPKEDFILQCSWPDGTNCSSDNMELIITDYGICYKFKDSYVPNVTYSGSSNGLIIMLNIATYDNIKGSEKTTGAKLALYDNRLTPLVSHIGLDSPPGFQTAVSVGSEITSRLPKKEKGNCDPNVKLRMYKNYTQQACRVEQSFFRVIQECQCKPYNMPDENLLYISSQLCNAQQQFFCALPLLTSPIKIEAELCPETCLSKTYSMTLSYSQISDSNVEKALKQSRQLAKMTANYEKALNIRSAYEAATKVIFNEKVINLLNVYSVIHRERLEPNYETFKNLQVRLSENVSNYKSEFLWKQHSTVTVTDVLSSKQPVTLKNALNALQEILSNFQQFFSRTQILFPILDQYQWEKNKLVEMDNQVNVNESVKDDPTFMIGYKSTKDVHAQLLSKIHDELNQISKNSVKILAISKASNDNATMFALNDVLVTNSSAFLQFINATFNQVHFCMGANNFRLQDLSVMMGNTTIELVSVKSQILENEQKTFSCLSQLENFTTAVNSYYKAYSSVLLTYQLLLTHLDIYKMDQYQFYNKLNSEQVVTFIENDYFFIQNLCTNYINRVIDTATFSKALISSYNDFWIILQDHFSRIKSQLLSARINIDNFLRRAQDFLNDSSTDPKLLALASNEFLGSLNSTLITYQRLGDMQNFLIAQTEFLSTISKSWRQAFDTLMSDCINYQASFVIGDNFYSTNIVIYNIYFKELTITQFTQFLTYSSVGMFGDIAGIIGVILGFLGTTAVTLFTTLKHIFKTIKVKIKRKIRSKEDGGEVLEENTVKSDGTVIIVVQHAPTEEERVEDNTKGKVPCNSKTE